MFKKILIANRGEIACRVIRTARKMGIKTVAVYSDVDADSIHVKMADEAVLIGEAAAKESYLRVDKILDAARAIKADAVHPGYGFLSENKNLPEALSSAGIKFIGPPKEAIEVMGNKVTAKKLAADSDVNTVPGHIGIIPNKKEAVNISKEIGYPVMIKAAAGGGGKGMRIAHGDNDVMAGFESAQNEARSSFGDETIFIEKYITNPRHIEIQILADSHGNCIHLGERECTIQRRHQKIIEESPSPFLDDQIRVEMGLQAIALAKRVSYVSAGTIEFVVDPEKNFYFLEMNTRLQVEHPVTEFVTGIDLVEMMIRVAAGEELNLKQNQVPFNGWSIECRVCAEDPYRNFLPSTGRLTSYRPPTETPHVRVDTGVNEGSEISVFYDPMIAKLITFGGDRMTAISRMRNALDQYDIRGVKHNLNFLSALLQDDNFVAGEFSTAFIAEKFPDGFRGAPISDELRKRLVGIGSFLEITKREQESTISGQILGYDPKFDGEWIVSLLDEKILIDIKINDTGLEIFVNDSTIVIQAEKSDGQQRFTGYINEQAVNATYDKNVEGFTVNHYGVSVPVVLQRPHVAEFSALMPAKSSPDTSKFLLCPMPGLVITIDVAEGDQVRSGQSLAVIEAMKMENTLRAERDSKVISVKVAAGDSLAVDEIIMEFE